MKTDSLRRQKPPDPVSTKRGQAHKVIAASLNHLWRELVGVLRAHRGTLNHYAGDALYAVWELQTLPEADELAIDFALAANHKVEELGTTLPLRDRPARRSTWAGAWCRATPRSPR